MRRVIIHSRARDVIRRFPKEVRTRLGQGLYRLQLGEQLGMPASRPMSVVAPGVSELRLRDAAGIYRAFYYAAFSEGIFVFHAFVKKTERTPPLEIEVARKRLKEFLDA